jgi:hypothetical protein
MFVCCECCVLSGRGLCDGLTTCPGESYRLWRVVVCDQETSKTRRLKPAAVLWKIQPQWAVRPGKQTNNMESYNTIYWTNLSFVHVGLLLHSFCIQEQDVELPPECTLSLTKYALAIRFIQTLSHSPPNLFMELCTIK